jgi:CRISPR-associated protein Cas1
MSDGVFSGRLGLAGARIPHVDRHGLLWFSRGNLFVVEGTLTFRAAASADLAAGVYTIPYQGVSIVLMGPGTTISHDALRILANHGTCIAAVGDGGVKFYTAPPLGQGHSDVARAHARLWASTKNRLSVARRMYAIRFGQVPPHRDISVLRGIEGARVRETYRIMANSYGVPWHGRHYDRANPGLTDIPNQAINHAATFVEAAAEVAVAAVGALPPLGFIHEESSNAFILDIADLHRADVTLPLAFSAAQRFLAHPVDSLERMIRKEAAAVFRKKQLIASMIDLTKDLLHGDDGGSDS